MLNLNKKLLFLITFFGNFSFSLQADSNCGWLSWTPDFQQINYSLLPQLAKSNPSFYLGLIGENERWYAHNSAKYHAGSMRNARKRNALARQFFGQKSEFASVFDQEDLSEDGFLESYVKYVTHGKMQLNPDLDIFQIEEFFEHDVATKIVSRKQAYQMFFVNELCRKTFEYNAGNCARCKELMGQAVADFAKAKETASDKKTISDLSIKLCKVHQKAHMAGLGVFQSTDAHGYADPKNKPNFKDNPALQIWRHAEQPGSTALVFAGLTKDLRLFAGDDDGLECESLLQRVRKTQTDYGHVFFDYLFATPSKDPEILKARQAFVKELVENPELYERFRKSLAKIEECQVVINNFIYDNPEALTDRNLYLYLDGAIPGFELFELFSGAPFNFLWAKKLMHGIGKSQLGIALAPVIKTLFATIGVGLTLYFLKQFLPGNNGGAQSEDIKKKTEEAIAAALRLFGLDNDAIGGIFRRLSPGCHPDKHPGDSAAAARFQELGAARDLLTGLFNSSEGAAGILQPGALAADASTPEQNQSRLRALFSFLNKIGVARINEDERSDAGPMSWLKGKLSSGSNQQKAVFASLIPLFFLYYGPSRLLNQIPGMRGFSGLGLFGFDIFNIFSRGLGIKSNIVRSHAAYKKVSGIIFALKKMLLAMQELELTIKSCPSAKAALVLCEDMNDFIAQKHSMAAKLKKITKNSAYPEILSIFRDIFPQRWSLARPLEAVGQIDAFVAAATLVRSHQTKPNGFCYVDFDGSGKVGFNLSQFWNPYIPSSEAVPNSLALGLEQSTGHMLLSGPNGNGKSTILRAVGFSLLMGQVFGITPAKTCRMSLYDIFASCMSTKDNPAEKLSASMVQINTLKNIRKYLLEQDKIGRRSFLAMDEVYNGMNDHDGPAMGQALGQVIANQLKNNTTLLTSHFYRMGDLESLTGGKFANFKVIKDLAGATKILYNLGRGRPERFLGANGGIEIASACGEDHDFISQASANRARLGTG